MYRKRCIGKKKLLLLFITSILYQLQAYAQIPQAYNFNRNYTFNPRTIYCLYEDSRKNIWVGTNKGLFKFDGTSLEQLKDENYPIEYTSIQEDKTGQIWCQNFTGQVFVVDNDSLRLFADESNTIDSYLDFTVSHFPSIYFGTASGIINYNFHSKERISYNSGAYNIENLKETPQDHPIHSLQSFKKGLLYLDGYKVKYQEEDGVEIDLAHLKSMAQEGILRLFPADDKILVLGNGLSKGIYSPLLIELYLDGSIREMILGFDEKINNSSAFFEEETDRLWLGTKSGVVILDSEYNILYRFLKGKNIANIIRDHEGNYWIATLNDGIFIVPSLEVLSFGDDFSLDKNIISIEKGKQGELFFIGEYGDIYQVAEDKGVGLIGDMHQQVEHVTYNDYKNELCFGNLPNAFDIGRQKVIPSLYGRDIKAVSFINPELALTSNSGSASLRIPKLHIGIRPDSSFILQENQGFYFHTLRKKRSQHNIVDSKEGCFYVGYADGLFLYKNGVEKELFDQGKSIIVTALSLAEKGVWCGNIWGEILKIDSGQVKRRFQVNTNIQQIFAWKDYLFLSSDIGVIKLNRINGKTTVIDQLDGLPSSMILDVEIFSDTLYVATSKGVAVVPCSYQYANTTSPSIEIGWVSIWEKDTVLSNHYFLEHSQNNITIGFNAKAFRSQKTFRYKYRMTGIDTNWIYQGSEVSFARYPQLSPGSYIFEVIAINEDNYESTPAFINFHIDAPIYQKWWFYLLASVFLLSMVSLIFLMRVRAMRKRNKLLLDKENLEKKFSQSQIAALRSQMNPHFVFNAFNSIQDYIVSNKKELAGDYLGLLADLMRKYLTQSQKNEITLEEEIETLRMYLKLEKLRFEKTLKYTVEIHTEQDISSIKIPVMLIQPFVENAIKHGLLHKKGQRKLDVIFVEEKGTLTVSVIDNGIGREKSLEINALRNLGHQSFATSAIQKRVELLNKERRQKLTIKTTDLFDDNGQSIGTQIDVAIPLSE